MGFHLVSKTWRAPLRLIDSWLPVPSSRCQPQRITAPLMQRFVRAGWLGRETPYPSRVDAPHPSATEVAQKSACDVPPVRVVRPTRSNRESGRLVISGRLSDVCAELERLAALEQPSGAH
jgi:hypothetical protein